MTEALIRFVNFSILPAELFAAVVLCMLPLRRRSRFLLRTAAGAGGILLLSAVWVFTPLGEGLMGLLIRTGFPLAWTLLYSFRAYILAAVLAWFCCEITLPEALYCATCAYLTQHVAYCLNRLLTPGIADGDLTSYTWRYFVIYGLVYVGTRFFVARQLTADGGYRIDLGRSLGVTAGALAAAVVLSALGQQLQAQSAALYVICLLYSVSSAFFILWGQINQQKQLSLQHELDVRQQLWLKSKRQYEQSAENVELINRKCHDLKHQIAALKHISDQAARDSSIRELEKSVLIYEATVRTGNDILDTVLTEKSLLCEDRGITLACVADGACLSFLNAVDLYTIFGNALDNAIECAGALTDPDKRIINVAVFARAGVAVIQLENFYEGTIRFDRGLPQTHKTQEPGYHGYGLKSIRATAEKYGGVLRIETGDGIFQLKVTIPIETEKEALH